MNIANKLNKILKEYSLGNKLAAYKEFKKIFLKNKKNTKLRYNLAVMENELGFVIDAKKNYEFSIELFYSFWVKCFFVLYSTITKHNFD